MRRNKQIAVHEFSGGMNADVDVLFLPPGDYREAHNMEGGYGTALGTRVQMNGNRKIDYTLPPGGPYYTIGAVENKADNSLIYFVYEEADTEDFNHLILEYRGGIIRELFRGPIEFGRYLPVHSAVIVNGVLYWADGVDLQDGFGLLGASPKMMNLERFRPNKAIRYELILNADCYEGGVEFVYSLYALDGTLTQSPTVLTTFLAGGGRDDYMLDLFNALDAEGFLLDLITNSEENPAPRLVFSYGTDKRVVITVSGGSGTPELELNELNYYPLSAEGATPEIPRMLTIIKPAPPCPPNVSYEKDAALGITLIQGFAYQFRYRYVFENNEKSAWGPASRSPSNFVVAAGNPSEGDIDVVNDDDFNKIVINIDDKYTKSPWRWIVKKVELCYRLNRDDPWKFIDSYELYEFTLGEINIDFIGSAQRSVVPSDQTGAPEIQALKNFDTVPLVAAGLEAVYDKSGNAILALGAGIYDYHQEIEARAIVTVENNPVTTPADPIQITSHKGLKRGGVYRVGIIHKDAWGRQDSVQYLETVKISAVLLESSSYEVYNLRVEMQSPPPDWAEYWQVVISQNQKQEVYWQSAPVTIDRYNVDPATGELSQNINGRYFGFEFPLDQLAPIPEAMAYIFENLASSTKVFAPEVKDRIQLYKIDPAWTGAQTPVNADSDEYDYEIDGYGFIQTGSPVATSLVVLIKAGGFSINWRTFPGYGSCNAEIYRPQQAPIEDLYYEFGPCGDIPVFGLPYAPVSLVGYGDTYLTRDTSTDSAAVLIAERSTLYPESVTPEWDLGRAVAYDPAYGEKYFPNIVRTSEPFIQGTTINGLSSYKSGEYINLPERIGPLKKLVMNQTVLLAIGAFKTQPIYVAKDRLLALNATLVGRTEQLLNIADETMLDLGTNHPESILYEQGMTYGLDVQTGREWRYTTGSGQFPISDYGMIAPFQSLAYLVDKPGLLDKCPAGFDRDRKSLYVTTPSFTLVFKEGNKPRWISYADFQPEYYGRLNRVMVSFKDGELYVHDKFATPAMFFGAQQEMSLTFVVNSEPDLVKLYDSLEIHSSGKWWAPLISTFVGQDYTIMRSKIPENKWSFYEGVGKAEFMRDSLDPSKEFVDIADPNSREAQALLRGRPLRGQSLQIKIQFSQTGQTVVLRRAYAYWQHSPQTVMP